MKHKLLSPNCLIVTVLLLLMGVVIAVGITASFPKFYKFKATGQPQIFMWQEEGKIRFNVFIDWDAGTLIDFAHIGTVVEMIPPQLQTHVMHESGILVPNFDGVMADVKEYAAIQAHEHFGAEALTIEITLKYKDQRPISSSFLSKLFTPTPAQLAHA